MANTRKKRGAEASDRGQSGKTTSSLSSDDVAIIAGIVVVIGDLLALWALLLAKREDEGDADEEGLLALISGRKSNKKRK
ncbi:MAG: hypothetical protein K0Q63_718 [Paenibacillus sp.]|jgi:hypothetical protein|nr:hypothetical protein [Paenibacillus sp.]